MKVFVALVLFSFLSTTSLSSAQYASTKKAQYVAILAAVMNYKINDETMSEDLQSLRENERFMTNLQKKLDKLSNDKGYDAKNRKVMDILEQAGRDLDRLL